MLSKINKKIMKRKIKYMINKHLPRIKNKMRRMNKIREKISSKTVGVCLYSQMLRSFGHDSKR